MKISNFDYFNKTNEATNDKFANKAKSDDFDIDIKFAAKGSDPMHKMPASGDTCTLWCHITAFVCPTNNCS